MPQSDPMTTTDSGPTAPVELAQEDRAESPGAGQRLRSASVVDFILLMGIAVALVAGTLAIQREFRRPPVWWESPDYLRLEAASRGMKRATFLSDGNSSEHNTRLHTTQYSIIPCVLRLTLEWSVIFARLDSGEFIVCDFARPAALDAAIEELKTWAAKEKRDVIAQRLSPHIALLKAGERP